MTGEEFKHRLEESTMRYFYPIVGGKYDIQMYFDGHKYAFDEVR